MCIFVANIRFYILYIDMEGIKREKILLKEYWEKLSPLQRKNLTSLLNDYGLPRTKAIRRINIIGFSAWEYEGVYILLNKIGIRDFRKNSKIWHRIDPKEPFYNYMYENGMSRATTNVRFSKFRFKSWEMTGIKNIIQQFESSKK